MSTLQDLLQALLWSPGFMLGMLALVAAGFALVLAHRLHKARDAASYTPLATPRETDLDYDPADSDADRPMRVVDLRGTPRSADLRRTFARVARLTERPDAGRAGRLPWFLALGAAAAGKSTLLGHSDLRLPFGEPMPGAPGDASPACSVWIFDRAVVVDVAGDLVLPEAGVAADRGSWMALLAAQRAARPRRPADGILLCLPVTELLAAEDGDATALRLLGRRADRLRRRLEQAQRAFGFRLPVSVVLTKCDLVPGFPDLLAALSEEERRQIFGWSNPYPADTAYSGSWPDDALHDVTAKLIELQLRALAEERSPADPQGFAALPATLESLRSELRTFLNRIFAGGPSPGAPPLRGVYLAAGEGFTEDTDEAHRRIDFVADLLPEKVFSEWDMARPEPTLEAQRLRLRVAARVLLVLLLVAGPLALLLVGWQGNRQARQLESRFTDPATRALKECPSSDCDHPEATRDLLSAFETVHDYRLRFLLLPGSWRSRLAHCVAELGVRVYERVVFPTLRAELDRRSDRVVDDAVPAPLAAGQRIFDLATVPAYLALDTMMGELDTLEDQVGRYQRFVGDGACWTDAELTTSNFAELTHYLFGVRPVPPTDEARVFYGQVLCDARPAAYQIEVHQRHVDQRVTALGREMLWSLYRDNALSQDLGDLETQIDRLASDPPSAERAQEVYRQLVNTIDRTQDDMADPRLAWAGKETLDLGKDYAALLQQINESRWTGVNEMRQIQSLASSGFQTFRTALKEAATTATGPLLARDGNTVLMRLSPAVLGLRAALVTLLDRYIQPLGDVAMTRSPAAGTTLSWDALQLNTAADTLDGYDAFVTTSFSQFPSLRPALTRSTRDRVERQVLALAAAAQRFPALPDLTTAQQLENQLDEEVGNLQAAGEPLNRLLTALRKPSSARRCVGADSPYCVLVGTLAEQQGALLTRLDDLLDLLRLYRPVPRGLSGWNGDDNLAWNAFGVADAKALTAYVAAQRGSVSDLDERYATPILATVPIPEAVYPQPPAALQQWTLLRADLGAYESKTADNPLLRLETFITADMATTSLADCLGIDPADVSCLSSQAQASPGTRTPPCDFFLAARGNLLLGTAAQCETLTLSTGADAYASLAGSFADRLAGRFPFAAAATSPAAAAPEATPTDVSGFYATYDDRRPQVIRLLAASRRIRDRQPASLPAPPEVSWPQPPWPLATQCAVGDFLTAADGVRTFFGPFLAAVAAGGKGPPPVPTYSLEVDLRPDSVRRERRRPDHPPRAGDRRQHGERRGPAAGAGRRDRVELRLDHAAHPVVGERRLVPAGVGGRRRLRPGERQGRRLHLPRVVVAAAPARPPRRRPPDRRRGVRGRHRAGAGAGGSPAGAALVAPRGTPGLRAAATAAAGPRAGAGGAAHAGRGDAGAGGAGVPEPGAAGERGFAHRDFVHRGRGGARGPGRLRRHALRPARRAARRRRRRRHERRGLETATSNAAASSAAPSPAAAAAGGR